jgi:predicted type IV restriction endonuclease
VQDLLDTLKQCVERLDRYRRPSQRVGESQHQAGLIEPIIATLGWDVLDPDEVHREYRDVLPVASPRPSSLGAC